MTDLTALPQTNAALAEQMTTPGGEISPDMWESETGKALLSDIASMGFGIMMQGMSQTMAEVNKVATAT